MKESKIEKSVCDYAKNKGWLVYKFSSPNNKGVPDRIFMRRGIMFFMEFKSFGKSATNLQIFVMMKIERIGFKCYVIDNVEEGKRVVDDNTKM